MQLIFQIEQLDIPGNLVTKDLHNAIVEMIVITSQVHLQDELQIDQVY